MNSSSQDKVEGAGKRLSGNGKQAMGEMTDNPQLAKEGARDQREGKVQQKVGDIKKVFDK